MIFKQIPEDFVVDEVSNVRLLEKGAYSVFELKKNNTGTEEAIQYLSKRLHIPRRFFGYAGSKDKRAVTTQFISVKKRIKDFDSEKISVKFKGYLDRPISLGDLKGNKFIIIVREIKKLPLRQDFFVNYFGEQRFSKHNVDIGIYILKRNFKMACDLIDMYQVKNHLDKNPNDYVGALRSFPHKILTFYVHAVQSFFWNEVAATKVRQNSKDFFDQKYSMGVYAFSNLNMETVKIPYVSFDLESDEYNELLKTYGISLRDFIIREIPKLTPMGGDRDLIAPVNNLIIEKIDHSIRIEFFLPKGSYATVFLKKLFRE